jgi:hypothetical protein
VKSVCCASYPASTSYSLLWDNLILCQRLFLLLLCTFQISATYQACFPARKENPGQLSRYSDLGYWLDGLGFFSWQGKNVIFFSKRPYRFWGPPSLLFNGYWVCFPGVKRSGRELATHCRLHVVPKLGMSLWSPVCCNGMDKDNFVSVISLIVWDNNRTLDSFPLFICDVFFAWSIKMNN